MFSALPPYPGGKRRLAGRILAALPPPSTARVVLDAFLGGGSVSLAAKWRGYQVIANDVAERSVAVGVALVANDRTRLLAEDVQRALVRPTASPGGVESVLGQDVIPLAHARFVDSLLARAAEVDATRGALLRLLAIRCVLALRPLGNFGAKTVVRQIEARDWEQINPSVLREAFTRRVQSHPVDLARELALKINRGVFSNGCRNEVRRGDAFNFLADVEGDVVYLDPPYGSTQAYETALRPLDSILAGQIVDTKPSVFSGRHAARALDELVGACARVPRLVLSYGNAAMNPDAVAKLVQRHRKDVRMEIIAYAHLAAVASKETKERNVEILISAGRAK